MLQWIVLGGARELGADLADAVAQCHDVVESLVDEPVEVLGAASGHVDAALVHRRARRSGASAWGGCRR